MYAVKKIRIPLGNSILFLTLGFNKVMPRVIFRRFSRCEGNSLGDNILARIDILARINFPAGINFLIRCVLSKVGFNILKMILFFKVVSIYSITGDKVNSLLITSIAE